MSEATANKDAALKLFGHTIQLLDDTSSYGKDEELHKDQCDDGKDEAEEWLDHHPVQERRDNIKEWLPYNDCSTSKTSKSEEEQGETSNSPEKTLKKPDKIIPCPRCNSMETKFCYFNNYNMNQPRHFCKNCQRYWTAGGTMRNMPVGAGRRKHKNSVYHYRHISVPETDLTFDTHKPISDSMVDNTSSRNGFHKYEELKNPDNGDDHSDISSVTAVSSKDSVTKGGPPDMLRQNGNSFPPHLQLFTGAPWPYPPGYCLPVPFYPTAPYWGCTIPGSWNVPWISPPQNQMPPILGKHLRDENVMNSEPREESNSEKYLWFPKTLRIDDPGEAAKSSIWATLGIKHDAVDSVSGGGILKAFLPKSGENFPVSENSNVLQANPAAMSRSLNFNETS